MEIKTLALKATWPTKWVERSVDDLHWFYFTLPVKNKNTWECNMSPQDVQTMYRKDKILLANWSIWKACCEFNYVHEPENEEVILNQLLWGNSRI